MRDNSLYRREGAALFQPVSEVGPPTRDNRSLCCSRALSEALASPIRWPVWSGGRMWRREFLGGAIGILASWPQAGRAQQAIKAPKVGFLFPGPKNAATTRIESLLKGVREAGYAAPTQ